MLADFHLGASVVAGDGRKVGTLVSVVVEANGFDPRALVVREEESFAGRLHATESLRVTDEVIVPIAAVKSASHEVVQLSMSARDVRRQPPYLSYHLKPLSASTAILDDVEALAQGMVLPQYEETAAKPADEIEIDHGENVMLGTSGKRLGKVQDVVFDDGEMVGVVVRPDGLFKQDLMLPIRFISRADDMSLFAHLQQSDIDQLKKFSDA